MTTDEFDLTLSYAIKKTMFKVLKMATSVENGFLFFRNRTVMKVTFDQEECEQLLQDMIINKDNVIRYLRRKYIPTVIDDGLWFKDQACIQKAVMKDGYTLIHIAKSEPHKIITDTIHVMELLREAGYNPSNKVKFMIDQIQIAYQDTLLYCELLKQWDMQIPSAARVYQRQLLSKYKILEEVAKIKKRSVKRKFLRYHVKRGVMTWQQLRRVINIDDFSPSNIRLVCGEIREENKAAGRVVDY